jgi:histidinol dehydrogenase
MSAPAIGPVENHRRREEGALVYPVYSRRSRGLSVGINLFPDRKTCSFDCPYCEVFPFPRGAAFSLARMEAELAPALVGAKERGLPVRDICFSGNGEPTMAPAFPAALESAARIRDALAPEAALVLVTNGTGLIEKETFAFLRRAAGAWDLNIWLKLDAGTEDWYGLVNRTAVPFETLTGGIREFVRAAPVIIQTMVCSVNGRPPPDVEGAAWETLARELAASAGRAPAGLRGFQIYGKARPAPGDPLAEALPPAFLESRAASLRAALAAGGIKAPGGAEIPVEVFP